MTAITFELDDKLKEAADKVAATCGQSIEQMVKDYLESVVDKKEPEVNPLERIEEILKGKTERKEESPLDKIYKILEGKVTDPDVDWREEKARHIIQKHAS